MGLGLGTGMVFGGSLGHGTVLGAGLGLTSLGLLSIFEMLLSCSRTALTFAGVEWASALTGCVLLVEAASEFCSLC